MLKMRMDIHPCKFKSSSHLYRSLFFLSHAAVSYGNVALIDFLMSHGADLSLRDVDGDTPLLVCEDPEVYELLLRLGANAADTNLAGETIYEKTLVEDNEKLLEYFVKNHLVERKSVGTSFPDYGHFKLEEMDEEDDEEEEDP